MRTALREPLVHFLALGLLLVLFFEWRGGGAGSNRIVVTVARIEHLASGFARTWQRPPTEAELKGLVDDYVKEEIAAREAAAGGLDRDDAIIRRRLRQKFEFLVEDAADQAPPNEAELEAWLKAHPEAVATEPQVALRQVFVSPDRRGAGAHAEAERLLSRLRIAGPEADTSRLGDPSMLPLEVPLGPVREVGLTFGEDFARAAASLEPGQWAGPVRSTYGLHLVLVRERVSRSKPDLGTIRPQIEREVVAERRRQALDLLYQRLLGRYSVTIERPARPPATAATSAGSAR